MVASVAAPLDPTARHGRVSAPRVASAGPSTCPAPLDHTYAPIRARARPSRHSHTHNWVWPPQAHSDRPANHEPEPDPPTIFVSFENPTVPPPFPPFWQLPAAAPPTLSPSPPSPPTTLTPEEDCIRVFGELPGRCSRCPLMVCPGCETCSRAPLCPRPPRHPAAPRGARWWCSRCPDSACPGCESCTHITPHPSHRPSPLPPPTPASSTRAPHGETLLTTQPPDSGASRWLNRSEPTPTTPPPPCSSPRPATTAPAPSPLCPSEPTHPDHLALLRAVLDEQTPPSLLLLTAGPPCSSFSSLSRTPPSVPHPAPGPDCFGLTPPYAPPLPPAGRLASPAPPPPPPGLAIPLSPPRQDAHRGPPHSAAFTPTHHRCHPNVLAGEGYYAYFSRVAREQHEHHGSPAHLAYAGSSKATPTSGSGRRTKCARSATATRTWRTPATPRNGWLPARTTAPASLMP